MAAIPRITPAEAHKLMSEGYVYLDVRSEPEFAAGHPIGAHNVPLLHASAGGMKPNPDFLEVVAALYPKDTKLVVGCKSGGRSAQATNLLAHAGYTDLYDQRAGWDGSRNAFGAVNEAGWSGAGLPTETVTAGGSYGELAAKAGKR